MTWLTVSDIKRFRDAEINAAASIAEQAIADAIQELARHSRSRAVRKGHITRKANKAKRMNRTTLRLQEERRAGA